MTNKTLVGIITIFVGLNVVLLYFNIDLQNKIENAAAESSSWGFEQAGESTARIMHPEVSTPDSSLSLMVFLTDKGCMSCVENEVRNLNEFHKKFNEHLQVYILAPDTAYLEQLYVTFPVKPINPEEAVLDREFNFMNPVALVTDANGMVQMINVSEVGKPGKQNSFYERTSSLFQSVE